MEEKEIKTVEATEVKDVETKKDAKEKKAKKTTSKKEKPASKKESGKKKKEVTKKKVMKREEKTPAVADFSEARKICNKVLQKVKGLTLVENKHGAVQVKRDGDLMFSFRTDGKAIITHPIYEGSGKGKKRWWKHSGNKWDHLTNVPFSLVTPEILIKRCEDKKSAKDYHNEFYGKKPEESGIFQKAEAARLRILKLKGETETKKTSKKKESKKASKAKETVITREKKEKKTSKKKKSPVSPVIQKVAEEII